MDYAAEAELELKQTLDGVRALLDELVPLFHVLYEECADRLYAIYMPLHDTRWFGKSAVWIGQAQPVEIQRLARRIASIRAAIYDIYYKQITGIKLDETIKAIYGFTSY